VIAWSSAALYKQRAKDQLPMFTQGSGPARKFNRNAQQQARAFYRRNRGFSEFAARYLQQIAPQNLLLRRYL
jgi:hypothetical protein